MQEAMDRLHEEQSNRTSTTTTVVSKPDILEYLAFSTYMQGNVVRALSMTNELLEMVPTHQRALGNRVYYQEEIQKKTKETRKKRGEDGTDDDDTTSSPVMCFFIKILIKRDRYSLY